MSDLAEQYGAVASRLKDIFPSSHMIKVDKSKRGGAVFPVEAEPDVLEHLSSLNLAVLHSEATDTLDTFATRQHAMNQAFIQVLVDAGLVPKNEGWKE